MCGLYTNRYRFFYYHHIISAADIFLLLIIYYCARVIKLIFFVYTHIFTQAQPLLLLKVLSFMVLAVGSCPFTNFGTLCVLAFI